MFTSLKVIALLPLLASQSLASTVESNETTHPATKRSSTPDLPSIWVTFQAGTNVNGEVPTDWKNLNHDGTYVVPPPDRSAKVLQNLADPAFSSNEKARMKAWGRSFGFQDGDKVEGVCYVTADATAGSTPSFRFYNSSFTSFKMDVPFSEWDGFCRKANV